MEATDGELYRKHAAELTRFATGLVGPTHAPDVVSEAVLGCLEARDADGTLLFAGAVTSGGAEVDIVGVDESGRERVFGGMGFSYSP